MRNLNLVLLATVFSLCSSIAVSAPRYNVTHLGSLPGAYSYSGRSVNSSGIVVGLVNDAVGMNSAFIYQSGMMEYIQMPDGMLTMRANGINESGQVIIMGVDSKYNWHCLIYENGQLTNIADASGRRTTGNAINDSGMVTGTTVFGSSHHAYTYNDGVWTDLGVLDGMTTSKGFAINNLGHVAGYCHPNTGNPTASGFIWRDGIMTDLGTLGGDRTIAWGLNDLGQVVGESKIADGTYRAFLWQNDVMTQLGLLGSPGPYAYSRAYGINDYGQIVGSSSQKAFIWENGSMKDLNSLISSTSGWQLGTAFCINDQGYIVGTGSYQGVYSAFLLTPVPEPSSLAALGSLAALLSVCVRRPKT